MTNFFTNGQDMEQLTLALKAYAQTEKNLKDPNPDLFFNRATIYEYLERYSEAVRDYNLANAIDPNLHGDQKAGRIIDFVVKTATLVLSRGSSKQQKMIDMVKTIPSTISGTLKFPQRTETKDSQTYRVATIGDLQNGENVGAILTCKIVMHLEKHSEVPMTALIVDSAHNFCVASFYGTNKSLTEKVQNGDLLYIKNPQLIFTSLEFKQRLYSY